MASTSTSARPPISTRRDSQRLHRLKTGALLEASVGCAVALAAPPPEVAGALAAFAAELGLLFQIVDDVLDATGSDASLGKPAGSDERRGRRTYVTVLGLEGAGGARAVRERSEGLPLPYQRGDEGPRRGARAGCRRTALGSGVYERRRGRMRPKIARRRS